MGDVLPPLHSPYAALKANAVSPTAKAKKTAGASVKLFKEISPSRERLPSVPRPQERFAFLRGRAETLFSSLFHDTLKIP